MKTDECLNLQCFLKNIVLLFQAKNFLWRLLYDHNRLLFSEVAQQTCVTS